MMLITASGAIVAFIIVLLVSTWTVRGPRPTSPASQANVEGDAERGARLIVAHGCGSCHAIPGIRGARGTVGPPLGGIAGRHYIAGSLVTTPANLARWIADPQDVEPGTAMPDLGLSTEEARDVAAYFYARERR